MKDEERQIAKEERGQQEADLIGSMPKMSPTVRNSYRTTFIVLANYDNYDLDKKFPNCVLDNPITR